MTTTEAVIVAVAAAIIAFGFPESKAANMVIWAARFAAQVTHRFPLSEANEALATVRDATRSTRGVRSIASSISVIVYGRPTESRDSRRGACSSPSFHAPKYAAPIAVPLSSAAGMM